jgi:PHD/YefM family antitoxin component YafN of YafNO toxin-antitoxin module
VKSCRIEAPARRRPCTQRGRAAAVMVSVEEYERSNHEREILRLLAQGDKEVAAGKGYELEDVLKEAERILAK